MLAVLSTTSTKSPETCTSCAHNFLHLSRLHCAVCFFHLLLQHCCQYTREGGAEWGTILYELPLYRCLFWLRSVDFKRAVFVLRDCNDSCLELSWVDTENKVLRVIGCVCARNILEWRLDKTTITKCSYEWKTVKILGSSQVFFFMLFRAMQPSISSCLSRSGSQGCWSPSQLPKRRGIKFFFKSCYFFK